VMVKTTVSYVLRGANIIIAIPRSATAVPNMSHVVGRIPSTAHNHRIAIVTYTPPTRHLLTDLGGHKSCPNAYNYYPFSTQGYK
jgi:hypothetical protein